jgi:hypothetical protein
MQKIIRVMPWGKGQGAFVEIYESDFDALKHKLYVEEGQAPASPPIDRAHLDAALLALIDQNQTDADYVVGAMRRFYGDLFVDADEAFVRDLVKAPAPAVVVEAPVVIETLDTGVAADAVVADAVVADPDAPAAEVAP